MLDIVAKSRQLEHEQSFLTRPETIALFEDYICELEDEIDHFRRHLEDVRVGICEHYKVDWEAIRAGVWVGVRVSIAGGVQRLRAAREGGET